MIRPTCSVAVLAAVLVLTACSTTAAEPDPSESASAAATTAGDDVAAAKSALLAYVSAGNGVDYAVPETFDAVYATVTGRQLEYEKSDLEQYHEAGWSISGTIIVPFLGDDDADPTPGRVELQACIDSSEVVTRDADGQVRVPKNGGYNIPMTVGIELGADGTWKVADLTLRTGEPTCA